MAMYNRKNAEVKEKIRKHFSTFGQNVSYSTKGERWVFLLIELEIIE